MRIRARLVYHAVASIDRQKMSLSKLCDMKASFAGSSFRRFSRWLEFSWRPLRRIMAASRMMLPQTGENKHLFLVSAFGYPFHLNLVPFSSNWIPPLKRVQIALMSRRTMRPALNSSDAATVLAN